jgi:hypothetical protein
VTKGKASDLEPKRIDIAKQSVSSTGARRKPEPEAELSSTSAYVRKQKRVVGANLARLEALPA